MYYYVLYTQLFFGIFWLKLSYFISVLAFYRLDKFVHLVLSKYTHIQIINSLHNGNLLKNGFIDNQLLMLINC